MAFNRFPMGGPQGPFGPGPRGPGPGMPGPHGPRGMPGPGVNFHVNAPYYTVPPTFPIMGGPPMNQGWQGNPMMSMRPPMGNMGNPNMSNNPNMPNMSSMPNMPNMSVQPKDVGYWRGSDRLSPVRDNRGQEEKRTDRNIDRRVSPPRRSGSYDFHHESKEESSDIRRVQIVSRDKRYSLERERSDRRDREDSRDRMDDGPSGSKRMRYDDDRYVRERSPSDRYDDRNDRDRGRSERDRDRDRIDDYIRERSRGRDDDHRYGDDSRYDSLRHGQDTYHSRGGSRRSLSPRRDDRNGYRRSPGRRSLSRSPNRRSPRRRSRSWSSPDSRRSPGRRSPGRRSPRRRSPDWRSSDRSSPSRRSPRRRSPDRGSPDRGYWREVRSRSPDSRRHDGSLYRRSPDRNSRDARDTYRRSPDRYRRDEADRNRQSPQGNRRTGHQEHHRMSPEGERRSGPIQMDNTWECPKCGFNNFRIRRACYKCNFVKAPNVQRFFYPPQAKQPGNSPEEIMKRIHVSNLDPGTTAEDLAHYFDRWGRVVYANLVINTSTKRSKGYGFVSFSSASEASNAISNYHTIRGRAVTVNQLKYSEKIESRLEDLYDEISSDEEEDIDPRDNRTRFRCKVKSCGFQGLHFEFRHHWKEIHTSYGKYLICPVCDTACPDRTGMRRHLMFAHGVTDDGGAMDNILKNVNLEERHNPYYVDPGNVEKEGKVEILQLGEEPFNPFKVYKCPEKGCPFAASANPLLQHWYTKHLNTSNSLSCPVCSVKFIRKGLLIEHFRIGHGIGTTSVVGGLSVAGAERISSDEDEAEYDSSPYRFMCKVVGCKFQGPKSAFRRHWNQRHELMEKYLACPYCGLGCRDHSEVRYHMITIHKVKDDDPILDDALIRSFIKERINPDFLDPGDVEPEDKFEVPNPRAKQTLHSANEESLTTHTMSIKREEALKLETSMTSNVNQKDISKPDKKLVEKKSVTTQTIAKEPSPSSSNSNNPPAFEMMKYNSHNTDSIKKFLAWTDSLMEKLEEAHHEARKQLNGLEEVKQEKQTKKETSGAKKAKEKEKEKEKEKPAAKKTDAKKSAAKKTEAKKQPPRKTDTKSKETAKKKPDPSPIRPVETRGRYTNTRYKGRYRR